MSVKKFGARDINLTSSSGTPNITSPTNLNLNAQTVAISSDLSIGGEVITDLNVDGAISATGIITALSFSGDGSNLQGAGLWTEGTGDDIYKELGNVGIGTTVPTAKLDVVGGALFTGDVQSTSTGFSFLAGIGTNTATDDFSYLSDGEIVVNRLSNSTAFQASSSGTLGVTIDSDGEANFSINNAGGVVNVGPYQNSNNTFGGVSLFSVGAVKANRPSGQEDGNVWLGTLNGGITSRIYAGGDAHFNGNVGIATNVVDSSVALKVQGDAIVTGIFTGNTLVSTATTGTAPLSIASTTKVSNLNADLLDDQEGSYYLDYTNFTNTPSTISELSVDTTPQLGGDLDTNEFNIKFGDSIGINTNRAQFGISTDLQIYHDGIDSWIEESGTGNLYIKSNGGAINLRLNNIDQLKVNENAATEINYGNSKKFETTTDGVKITGLTTTQSLDVTNNAIFNGKVGINTTSVGSGTTDALLVGGHVIPSFHNTYDIGSNAVRWRNIYTTDLKLSNEGKVNDVDGTWGNYTIQEGEDDLYLINHRNGKKYKFVIQEVN